MKSALVILLIVFLAAWLVFVKAPEAKCAGIAQDHNAAYSFSAVRGCELRFGKTTWLLTPSYLREYQRNP